ncbi:MAG: hypothetical protein ABSA76_06590 [Bacteroidales bacterium]
MKVKFVVLFTVLFCLTALISCRKNIYRVNVSSVPVNIEIKRLEKEIFSLDPDKIQTSVPNLKQEYGSFLQLFSYVINTGDINDPSFGDFLVRFCTDKLNYEVFQEIMRKYPDTEKLKKELEDAFRHYIYYFPGKNVPAVYTCSTGFNNSIITGDSVLGIGLDRYLGKDCEYYRRLQIFKYLAARMTPVNIVPDCIYAWGLTEWDFSAMKYPVDNVMAEMMHEGKLKYFEKCMLPEVSDSIIFGFSVNQMKFCRNNESQMWQYLVEHNLLFSTDRFVIRKLTDEAPFTSYFTNESPGRASVWIGFRVIESYMMKNRNVTLAELMDNTDVSGILEKAKYNPR